MNGNNKAVIEDEYTQTLTLGDGQACLEALPQGVCMPLLDAIRSCRHRAPQHWPVEALRLVGREDLARQMELHGHRESATPTILPAPPVVSFSSDARDVDGMQALIAKSTLRFSRDLRLHEVRRLLCSSRPVALRIDGSGIDLSEHDLIHEQQTRLANRAAVPTAARTCSCSSIRRAPLKPRTPDTSWTRRRARTSARGWASW